ncbi:hypothetical protein EV13_0812 [Prochlorococcus sp. MIT 0702]|nr:hypothetical protein EV12_0989 [Prochlorococcus sp. MIT 0701]KGG29881.1 hypothetical protein EV13_0812 [Prochlorococcus sp. MIT 0702]KGG34451.1 hypothetical protein EV14_1206 [Prochlorococcus sp. MIT 0703]
MAEQRKSDQRGFDFMGLFNSAPLNVVGGTAIAQYLISFQI